MTSSLSHINPSFVAVATYSVAAQDIRRADQWSGSKG